MSFADEAYRALDGTERTLIPRLLAETDAGRAVLAQLYDGKKFMHNRMGELLLMAHHACIVDGKVHILRDKSSHIYEAGEDAVASAVIEYAPTTTAAQRKEVYMYLKQSSQTPIRSVEPPHRIPFKSKIFNLETRQFEEYGEKDVFLTRFPYDYIPLEKMSKEQKVADGAWKCLYQIADGDLEVLELILQGFGYCFFPQNRYRASFILYGENGANGKSTLLNMLSQMLGEKNISNLSPQDMENKFRLPMLYGKAANIGDDIPSTQLGDTSQFKRVITGEMVTAEQKGKDPFTFKPQVKCFFACNTLPKSADKSGGFLSRLMIIPLNHDFRGENGNTSFKNRTWSEDEMTFLIAEAMRAFIDVYDNGGKFHRPCIVVEMAKQYQIENDSALQFLEECGGVAAVLDKSTQRVYEDYLSFCSRSGIKQTRSRPTFTKAIKLACSVSTKSGYCKDLRSNGQMFYIPDLTE